MTKAPFRPLIISLFTVVYAAILSLGAECLLNLLSAVMSVSLDSPTATEQYPRFIAFCIIVGIVALLALIAVIILNFKLSERLKYNKNVSIIQSIVALAVSVPLIGLWELLFKALQNTF